MQSQADPLRKEIGWAAEYKKTIIPAFTPNFSWSDLDEYLPKQLASHVGSYNGLEVPHRYFKFAVSELCERFLTPVKVDDVRPSEVALAVMESLSSRALRATAVGQDEIEAQALWEAAVSRALVGDGIGGALRD